MMRSDKKRGEGEEGDQMVERSDDRDRGVREERLEREFSFVYFLKKRKEKETEDNEKEKKRRTVY